MKKEELRALVLEYGDCIIDYTSVESQKLKYNVCTLDFETPYVKAKQNRARETEETLLLWCWDTDSFRLIKCSTVRNVQPLAQAIQKSHG